MCILPQKYCLKMLSYHVFHSQLPCQEAEEVLRYPVAKIQKGRLRGSFDLLWMSPNSPGSLVTTQKLDSVGMDGAWNSTFLTVSGGSWGSTDHSPGSRPGS